MGRHPPGRGQCSDPYPFGGRDCRRNRAATRSAYERLRGEEADRLRRERG
ncbi:hypothetical protein BN2537_16031 [Streptomyces venezuelae]|nr:hypothetical protein BN2537_16031 [Streptomyces venezuelae]